MKVAPILLGAAGVVFAVIASPPAARAQVQFPEGPNRELVTHTCTQCHGLELVMGRNGSDAGRWAETLDEMESNGLLVSPDDRTKIIEYLATYLGPRTGPATDQRQAGRGR